MGNNENKTDQDDSPENASDVVIRRLSTQEDYGACVALQKETWGGDFVECVPPAILMVTQKIGGVTAGAFDASGKLIGFVFGMTGWKDGQLVHWSDMLAVRPEARDLGLGRRLKNYQRELVREIGVRAIYWTYDPLVARNAHLNLNRLGATISEYVPDMYGEDMAGELNRGLGTDRFVVEWDISGESAGPKSHSNLQNPGEDELFRSPVVNTATAAGGHFLPATDVSLPLVPVLRVEIPDDIQVVKATSLESVGAWRSSTRQAFMHYLRRQYKVAAFYRDAQRRRCFYVLSEEER